ncbi:MAG: tyrosine-type recombinase/integrase [Treponema sp.]|jgi:hypothetical protein|nr:tyrosine-type recombinase/integrase [Treponema sp.]
MGFFAMHNDFTLFFRTVPSGKNVVYYYAYDDEGNRLGPWTTGQPNKTAAQNYCNRLNRQGKLLPGPKDKNIGLTEDEVAERGLNFHAWRHFCNTELQKAGLTVKKVQAVTGHKSERMTEWYTHFDPAEFGEVPKIQANLLKPKPVKKEAAKTDRPVISLVKMPEDDRTDRRRKAS